MAKRIAFLSRLPELEIFSKNFGIDYLSQNGFEVVFLDVSYLIDGMKWQIYIQIKHRLLTVRPLSGSNNTPYNPYS
jgi:hypothetical protein|tara:strand:- start:235 stop:462 length:228 start_codon:yes stop_codon:yes gene_type:complete